MQKNKLEVETGNEARFLHCCVPNKSVKILVESCLLVPTSSEVVVHVMPLNLSVSACYMYSIIISFGMESYLTYALIWVRISDP